MLDSETGLSRHWAREGTLIGLVTICVYLMIALWSLDPADPGWSQTGSLGTVRNAVGASGAWVSDVLFSLFGLMAYLLPFMLFLRACLIFLDKDPDFFLDWVTVAIRLIGFALVIVSATSLVSMNIQTFSVLPFGQGGVIGRELAEASLGAFNLLGSRIVMLAIGLFGLTIFADISWLNLIDKLGARSISWFEQSHAFLQHKLDEYNERKETKIIQQRRVEKVEIHHEKLKKRPAPKIAPAPKKPEKSERAQKENQGHLFDTEVSGELPPLNLLDEATPGDRKGYSEEALEAMSRLLEIKLADFNIQAEVVAVYPGPVITRFEIQPAAGTKASRISNLASDLARSLAVISVRVVEVIPGKSVMGIEIPNEDREMVFLRDVLASKAYEESKSPVCIALGHDISGEPVVADLAKMPHLLVAGTTGSGKSVGVNAMILSLLYKASPAEVRLLLVDPKMLELSVYEGIPHLLTPVITDMKDAANGLRWCVAEMERRYKLMAAMGVRNVAGFNKKVTDAAASGNPILDPLWKADEFHPDDTAEELQSLPFIVVVIDEFADMMMIVGKKVEQLIARIAQKARAAGIHLVLATQRPSVDVITGLIKANVPTRIAFQVSSKIDSRTILDQGGGEQLLGHGDMLYLPPGSGMPVRVHGAFVADEEVHRVVENWKQRGQPNYIDGLLDEGESSTEAIPGFANSDSESREESDPLYDEAVEFVTETRKASISSVQRKLRIGYNRAARMIETMEASGVITAPGNNGSREVLAPAPRRD